MSSKDLDSFPEKVANESSNEESEQDGKTPLLELCDGDKGNKDIILSSISRSKLDELNNELKSCSHQENDDKLCSGNLIKSKIPQYISVDLNNTDKAKNIANSNAKIHSDIVNDEKTFENDNSVQCKISSGKNNIKTRFKKYLGIMLALAAALSYSMSGMIIKILNYHPFNLGVWRFFVMTLIPIPILVHDALSNKKKIFQDIWPISKTTWLLLFQAAVGSNSLVLVFYGIQNLHLADCGVISTSAPVFVTFLAFCFLGEKFGVVPVVTALIALCGVAIISRPPFLTGGAKMEGTAILGVAAAFGSMMLLTVTYVITRHMRTVHHAMMNLTFCIWGFIQTLIIGFIMDVISTPSNLTEVGLIIASAPLAFLAQTCIILALKYEQAGPVALVRTSEVIFAFILQLIFLGVKPDIFSIIGACLVISGVVVTTFRKVIFGLPEDHKYRKIFWFILM